MRWSIIDRDVLEEVRDLGKMAESLEIDCNNKTNEIRKTFSFSETEKDKLLVEDVQRNLMEVRNAFCEVPYLRGVKDPFKIPVKIDDIRLNFEFHLFDNPKESVVVKGVVPKEKLFCEPWHITDDCAIFGSRFRTGIDNGLETAKFISDHWTQIREEIITGAKKALNNDIKELLNAIAAKDAYLETVKENEEDKEL